MIDNTDPFFIEKYRQETESLPPPVLRRAGDRPNRIISGGIARTPNGRLWAIWLLHGESRFSKGVLAYSDDDGRNWSEPCFETDSAFTASSANRCTMCANLWTAPDGRLFCFFDSSLEIFDGLSGIWQTVCENPDDPEPVWSTPVRLWHGWAINKPVVMSSGEWMLSTSLMVYPLDPLKPCICDHRYDNLRHAHVLVSRDAGASWEKRGGVKVPDAEWSFYESMPVLMHDGSIRMYIRSTLGISQSDSHDGGWTWTPLEKLAVPHPPARIFSTRLKSGKLLMVRHKTSQDNPRRECLCAFLSEDNGLTWNNEFVLDERYGVSYPDGFQSPDGKIYITYDHYREDGEILLAVFSEEDILAGKAVSADCRLKQIIKRLPGYTDTDDSKKIHIKLVANQ